jgi:hypothetical protein
MVGRDAELQAVERFLGAADSGGRALVIAGEAGIGKTALWEHGVATAKARGLAVLQARPAERQRAGRRTHGRDRARDDPRGRCRRGADPRGGRVTSPECPASVDVAPGDGILVSGLEIGNHRFLCCFHPWMRAVIKVQPRGHSDD